MSLAPLRVSLAVPVDGGAVWVLLGDVTELEDEVVVCVSPDGVVAEPDDELVVCVVLGCVVIDPDGGAETVGGEAG